MIARRLRMNTASKSNILRLVSYLTDSQQNGQRVENVRLTNCDSESASWAAMEMLATQKQNTRAKGDKTYHLMLSFHERLSPEQLQKIEDEVCDKLGFTGHQRVSVLHGDTENPHLHIAINKIHPEKLTMFEPYYDHSKLADACLEIEQRYGLTPDNHVFQAEARETAAKSMEVAGDLQSLIGWVQTTCLEKMKQAKTWDELHDVLSAHGLIMRPRGNGLVIASGSLHIKASSVDRSLSMKRLEEKFGEFTPGLSPAQPEQYVKRPMPLEGRDADSLWEQFQAWRKKQDTDRNTQLTDIQRRREDELAANSLDLQRAITKHMVEGRELKRVLYAMQHHEAKKQRKAILAKYSRERRETFRQAPSLTWRTWLESKAKTGDQDALSAIRARKIRDEERVLMNDIRIWADTDTTQIERPEDQRKQREERTLMKDIRIWADTDTTPTFEAPAKVTRKGTLLYADGCRDDGHILSCVPHHRLSSGDSPIKSMLMKASALYGDRPLCMEFPLNQRQRIAQLATTIPISFESPDMERRVRCMREVLSAAQYSLPVTSPNERVQSAELRASQASNCPKLPDAQRSRHRR